MWPRNSSSRRMKESEPPFSTPQRGCLFRRYFFFQFMLIYSINLTKHRHTYTLWKSMADRAIRQIARERERERGTGSGGRTDCNSCVNSVSLRGQEVEEGSLSVRLSVCPYFCTPDRPRVVFWKQIFSDKWKSDVIYGMRWICATHTQMPPVSIATWHAHTVTERKRESESETGSTKWSCQKKKNREIGSKSWSPSEMSRRCRKCVRQKKRKQNFGIRERQHNWQLLLDSWQVYGGCDIMNSSSVII